MRMVPPASGGDILKTTKSSPSTQVVPLRFLPLLARDLSPASEALEVVNEPLLFLPNESCEAQNSVFDLKSATGSSKLKC